MNRTIRVLLLGALLCAPAVTLAQTSRLYITSFDWPPVHHIAQNGAVVQEWQTGGMYDGDCQWAMAVTDTIKIYASSYVGMGYEYDLDGNMIPGNTYPNTEFLDCFDGATDGTHNWTIAHNDWDEEFPYPVVVADADWGGARVAFAPERRSSGITYDGNSDTLWVTNVAPDINCDRVQQYSLEGELLSEFNIDLGGGQVIDWGGHGIAWDPADDTLWISAFTPFGAAGPDLHQFDKQGNLLQSVDLGVTSPLMGAMGLEFQMVPEPTSALLLVAALVAVCRRR
ncbi:MAG: hypothetical protein PVJ57_22270 [Phycisphaerae bacterium]|jgi:hypothetical protein